MGSTGKKILKKRAEAMEKNVHELKVECSSVCGTERKKKNSFEITVIIFKVYKKCKSPIHEGF